MMPDALRNTFANRTVILTGAASGIGHAVVINLLDAGAVVHALDYDEIGLKNLADASSEKPGQLITHVLDVSDSTAYGEVFSEITKQSPQIDFLFNNAGVTLLGEFHQVSFERCQWLLNINLKGVIHGIHYVYPWMVKQKSGHIINTASIAGATGYATAAAYTASKAAVIELTRSLRAEAHAYGVKLSVACPGYVNSGIFAKDRIIGVDRDQMIADLPVKMMTPQQAADGMLTGIIKGKKTIIFPANAFFLWTLAQWLPCAVAPFQKQFLRTFRGK